MAGDGGRVPDVKSEDYEARIRHERDFQDRLWTLLTALLDAAVAVPVKQTDRSDEEQRAVEAFTEAIVRVRSAMRGGLPAGDGGRVPDVSEQRAGEAGVEAVARDLLGAQFEIIDRMSEPRRSEYKADVLGVVSSSLASAGFSRVSDPASVLAALLAESPEATVAALEALLTSETPVRAAAHVMYEAPPEADVARVWDVAVSAAVRSLLSKAPKEAGDA